MKLSKLYSNDARFKKIAFNLNKLNVIYADVVSDPGEKKNSHDLGKTKLAELIDFLFLKGLDKKSFLLKVPDDSGESIFSKHIFYLELLLNSGKYLTIRRAVANHSKISFILQDQSVDNFNPPQKWDFEELPFKQAKGQLAQFLAIDFFKNKSYDFRKAINYCIRMQNDYEDVYKLSKYKGGKDYEWKPFMFDLLGFNGNILAAKYKNDEERESIKTFIDSLKNEYSVRVEDRDDIVAQIKLKESNTSDVEEQIDRFNFYEQDKQLINKGIEEIEHNISDLNTLSYQLNYDIDKLQRSIKNKFAFSLDKVTRVFQESALYFPEQLKEDYQALISFNNELTIERNKLLKTSLNSKSSELKNINAQLLDLNKQKESLLSYLKDTDSFKRFKFYQKELVKIEGELLQLRQRLNTIDRILSKEKDREELHKAIEGTLEELRNIYQHTEDNQRYSDIRSKFSRNFKAILDENAYISWNINTNNNVEFVPPKVQTKGELTKDTAKDDGRTYKKMLCVAFDLAILSAYNKESYFRFVYHDDVLSQQDNGIKSRLLSLIHDLIMQFDLQYILSVIKSDLPVDANDLPIYFPDEEIILNLHDRDETGTLFGFEF